MNVREFLKTDVFLKLLALLLSLGIWMYVSGSKRTILFLEVPVDFVNLPSDMVIVEVSHSSVKLKVRTGRRLMEMLTPVLRAEVDLSKVKGGENIIEITQKNVKAPPYLKIVSVTPSFIRVEVEHIERKIVSIAAMVSSEEEYYIVKNLKVSPSEMIVEGPRRYLPKEDVLTLMRKIRCEEGYFELRIENPVSGKGIIKVDPPFFTIAGYCEKNIGTIWIKNVPVEIINRKHGMTYSLEPDKINIHVKGWTKILKMDINGKVKAFVNAERYGKGIHRINPQVELPDGVELLTTKENRLTLTIK